MRPSTSPETDSCTGLPLLEISLRQSRICAELVTTSSLDKFAFPGTLNSQWSFDRLLNLGQVKQRISGLQSAVVAAIFTVGQALQIGSG